MTTRNIRPSVVHLFDMMEIEAGTTFGHEARAIGEGAMEGAMRAIDDLPEILAVEKFAAMRRAAQIAREMDDAGWATSEQGVKYAVSTPDIVAAHQIRRAIRAALLSDTA